MRASVECGGHRRVVGGHLWLAAAATLVALVLGLSALAHAQEVTGPEIEQLQVDLWPQYDDPRLLVIYKGDLAAAPDRPLRFTIPAGAKVNAVARLGDQDRLVDEAWESEVVGDQQVISLTPKTASFQLEYYVDVIGSGPERSFTVDIDVGGQPVKVLGIAVQQPVGASNLRGEPALQGPVVGFQGLSYFTRQIEGVQAGQRVRQTVTYTKPDDVLTAPKAQAAGTSSGSGFSTNLAGRSMTRFWLPVGATAIIVVGLSLIGFGAWRARQERLVPVQPLPVRRGPRVRPQRDAEEGPARFCHQCGATFDSADRFCAECGAPRRGV